MPYINVDTPLIRHRKFKKFKRFLNVDDATAIGYLVSLWSNVLDLAEDGEITKWNKEDIAEYSCYLGEPDRFFDALCQNGSSFIDLREDRIFIHDWWDYAGRYLTTKYRTSNPDKLNYIRELYHKKPFKTDYSKPKDILSTDKIREDKIDKIRLEYIYIKRLDIKNFHSDDYSRTAKAIKTLVTKAEGNDELVVKSLHWANAQKWCDWTLETIIRKWAEFMKDSTVPTGIQKYLEKK